MLKVLADEFKQELLERLPKINWASIMQRGDATIAP